MTTQPTRIIDKFGPRSARLLVNGKWVAGIGENMIYRDPSVHGPRDFFGQHLTNERVYFPTWEMAENWLNEI